MNQTTNGATLLTERIAADIDQARAERDATATALAGPIAAVRSHPNRAAYKFGGLVEPFGFGTRHILALIGLMHEPATQVSATCALTPERDAELPNSMRTLCETDARLEARGFEVCHQHGLLKRGRIDGFWLKRVKLGLGYAGKLCGFETGHANAMRGVFAHSSAMIGELIARSAPTLLEASFGNALVQLAAREDGTLARIGADALQGMARARYFARRASFEGHMATTGDARWRAKPPRSRQGHLAVTTANLRGVEMPNERQRGAAADWLEMNGANVRFVEGGE